jgi:hypothetical protein
MTAETDERILEEARSKGLRILRKPLKPGRRRCDQVLSFSLDNAAGRGHLRRFFHGSRHTDNRWILSVRAQLRTRAMQHVCEFDYFCERRKR